jgi:hypothetical protein
VPRSQAAANAPIGSVGFDFIQPPRVECEFTQTDTDLQIRIVGFESEAFSAAPSDAGLDDLAMVMVDYCYDGDVFDLDGVHFAEDLVKQDWTVLIPRNAAGEQLLIVYVDIFGNEFREVKTPESFVATRKGRRKNRL